MKRVRIVAALWRRDGKIFMAKRPEGKAHAGLWELPGGKQELGETAAAALAREGQEELGLRWRVGPQWAQSESDDGLSMRVLQVVSDQQPQALEGQTLGWFSADELADLPMPPLDEALRTRLIAVAERASTQLWSEGFSWVHGIGELVEQGLWQAGISDHSALLRFAQGHQRLDGVIAREQLIRLRQAIEADAGKDPEQRFETTAARHRWRLLDQWRGRCAALDFECDNEGNPTVMGLAKGAEFTAYIPEDALRFWRQHASRLLPGRWTETGEDSGLLDGSPLRLADMAQGAIEFPIDDMILVFGGRKFDMAMLRKLRGDAPAPRVVYDLLDMARRCRLRGGLKAVERSLGLARHRRIADLRGRDAITLWQRVQSGDEQGLWALADLIAYNRADAVNLLPLRDLLLREMAKRVASVDWALRAG